MRIGIFSDSYKPYQSGVVTSIFTFKEELTRMGHEVFIFAPSYPGYSEEEPGVYRFLSLPSPTNPDFTLAIPVLPGMSGLMKKLDLDIIHVQSPFTMGRVGQHYARKHNIPLVFTYHTQYDQYVHYVPLAGDLARDITIKYSAKFCNNCDHIVAPSCEIKDFLISCNVATPITVVPTGVSLNKFNGSDSRWLYKQYGIAANKKILLFVGRLTKEKNIEFLLQAFQTIHKRKPDAVLVLIARGPLEQDLKNLAHDLGVGEAVIFAGALPFETLVNAYYSSDLFVFSSITETQGLVILEAMACGLPAVAVRASGVQDMVDSEVDGILTSLEVNEFSDAVCRVLDDTNVYQSLKDNALKKARALSSENMAKRLEGIYLELCSNRPERHKTVDNLTWISK